MKSFRLLTAALLLACSFGAFAGEHEHAHEKNSCPAHATAQECEAHCKDKMKGMDCADMDCCKDDKMDCCDEDCEKHCEHMDHSMGHGDAESGHGQCMTH